MKLPDYPERTKNRMANRPYFPNLPAVKKDAAPLNQNQSRKQADHNQTDENDEWLSIMGYGGLASVLLAFSSLMIALLDGDRSAASRTRWFWLFVVTMVIGIVLFWLTSRLKARKRQQELEDREYELRKAQLENSITITDAAVSCEEAISSYFTEYQTQLKKQRQNLINKYDGVTRLIDSLFGPGTLTSARYSASVKKAYEAGISAAGKGADLCEALKGEDRPKESSQEVLDHYLELTRQMADLIENQIVVLAGLDLDRTEKIQSSLNEQIAEINSTLHMYE